MGGVSSLGGLGGWQVDWTGPDLVKTCFAQDVVLSKSKRAASTWKGQAQGNPSNCRNRAGTEHIVGVQRVLVELNWVHRMFIAHLTC